MVLQTTVLKVNFSCDKDRKKLLQAVSGIRGVDRVEIDVNKGTLTVTGYADPYEIILRTQKAGRFVEVISVGPPLASTGGFGGSADTNKKPEDKKPDQKPPPQAQAQAQSQAQPKAQPQAQPQAHVPQAQPQAQLQFHAQMPTQAHSHVQSPNPCPACQHMYMYQSPVWMSPMPSWDMRGNHYF